MPTALENAANLYMHGIRDGNPRDAVAAYTGARYIQHSTGVADGKEGFIAFFEPFLARNPVRDIRIIRSWQDGSHVFVQAFQSLNHGESEWLTTDFFDSDENGKIVEHWDVIAPVAPPNPSGRTQIDGPTAIKDLDKTDANKAHVRRFLDDCLIARRLDEAPRYLDANRFAQHNSAIGDGIDALIAHLDTADHPLTYQECFLMVGRGDFVATLNRARRGDQDFCQVDVFRLADGLIVEHWENSEPVPPRAEWANSGKF